MAIQMKQLEKIVGKGSVLNDDTTLNRYAGDQSFVERRCPDAVVFVETVEQIQEVVKLANQSKTPVVPYSSGMNLHGATVPDQGGIILNMSQMKKIIDINEENLYVIVEPGVTYSELQDALNKKGYRIMVPFGVPPNRSVLTSYLERDLCLAAPSFEDGNALIMDTEMVLPTGEIFRTGNWATGGEPGSPTGPIRCIVFRLWTGSQGTLGILTKMNMHMYIMPSQRKFFFIPFNDLDKAVESLARIQRREIGLECLLLNSFNMAALFSRDWDIPGAFPAEQVASADFEAIRKELPPWGLGMCLNGLPRHPEEKIAYEIEALKGVCDALNIELCESLPGISAAESIMLEEMLRPWRILKKFHYRGSVHDLSFKAPLDSIPVLEQTLRDMAQAHGYPLSDIGVYLTPWERGRGAYCEFDLHCNHTDAADAAKVKKLWLEASAALMNRGAYFDQPYGAWAEMVYNRAANYASKLRQIKQEMDPNNILNPGKLCFS